MFLSIIIPIWNDEKLLNECLDSCLDQQLSKDEYELICVDDGSTDRTPEILRGYAEHYPNIHIVTKQHGIQYGTGRTIGLGYAKGDYLWFVDHDDIVAPSAVDDLLKIVKENPGLDRIAFPCYEFYDELTEDEKAGLKAHTLVCNDDNIYQSIVTWSSIIRVAFLKEHDILPHSKRIAEAGAFWGLENFRIWSGDTIFMDECFDKGIKSLRITGRPLYHYRRHANTETMSMDPEMVKRRNAGMLNTGLYWAYLAYKQKEIYSNEHDALGKASAETAERTFFQINRAVNYILKLPAKQWRQALKRFSEIGIFFKHMPKEYPESFKEYWNKRSKREKLFPATISNYYAMTKKGARWTRLLSWPNRIIHKSKIHEKRRIMKVSTRAKLIGLSGTRDLS